MVGMSTGNSTFMKEVGNGSRNKVNVLWKVSKLGIIHLLVILIEFVKR